MPHAETRPNRIRSVASAVAAILCLLSLTSGLLLGYIGRVLFRPDAFADRVAASLAEPGVAALVATRLTDGLIQERRDLTGFRPIILGTTEALISSAPFRAVIRRAAKLAHQTLISETGKQISFSVSDATTILHSALSTNPELAEKIPLQVRTYVAGSNEAPGGALIVKLLQYGIRVRYAAIGLVLLALILGTTSFLLATHRRQLLLRFGIAIAVIGVVLRLTVRFGGDILAAFAKDPQIGGALAGLWHAFMNGFMMWGLFMAAIGIVLSAGIASLFGRIEMQAIRNRVWNWIVETPESKWLRLFRVVALMAFGVVAVVSPSFTLSVFAMLIGLAVFFVALRELFSVILLMIPQKETVQHAGAEVTPKTSLARISAVTAIVVLLSVTGLYIFVLRHAYVTGTQVISACNGYSQLCDRRINQVVFPATHNSMSAADIPNWMFPQQEASIPRQLQDGIRAFLIDAHYGMPAGDRVKTILEDEAAARKKYEAVLGKEGIDAAMRIRDRLVGAESGKKEVYLCHGFCELGATPLVPMLQKMREFLVMNPNEVITIVIQDEGVSPHDIEKCFQQSGLIDFVYRGTVVPPWPTLRSMIMSDQRVMVYAENNSAGVSWYHLAYETMQETPYTFHNPDEFSCRENRGTKSASLFLINHWIQTTPAPLPSNAEKVNAYDVLLARARQCQNERHMLPNVVAVDFYRTGDLFKVVETLNGIKRPRS